MRFEARTLQILKNYSTINPSLQFKEGNVITTVSPIKTVMSKATIKESIPGTFAIIDLSRFLGTLSLFESPEIRLGNTSLEIKSNNKKVSYTYTDPKLIVAPGEKEIKLPDPEISFALNSDVLQSVMKAMGVLGLPEIAISGEKGIISVEAIDSKNPSSDNYSIQIDTPIYKIDTNAKFRMIFLAENIKILPDSYTVNTPSNGIAHFKGNDIEYWIATESSSIYTG